MSNPLNVRQLHKLLTDALARGLDPETAVVVETDDAAGDWMTLQVEAMDPTTSPGLVIWFTLQPNGEFADSRSTYGDYREEETNEIVYEEDPADTAESEHTTYDATQAGHAFEGVCEVCGGITPTMHEIKDGFTPTMILCDNCYDK